MSLMETVVSNDTALIHGITEPCVGTGSLKVEETPVDLQVRV